jgi:hypothetical protein
MRWNSRLHQHFVHAVELLGGHESNALSLSLPFPPILLVSVFSSLLLQYSKKYYFGLLVVIILIVVIVSMV